MLHQAMDQKIPDTQLRETVRVPKKEEISHLASALSNKDRTVEIQKTTTGVVQYSGEYLPPGYMINIYERDAKTGFHRCPPADAKNALKCVCDKLGIKDPDIVAVEAMGSLRYWGLHSEFEKGPLPNSGVYIGLGTMGRLCAALQQREATR